MNALLCIELGSYRIGSGRLAKRDATIAILEGWFEAMTRTNSIWLLSNPDAPLLYESGVRYRRDPDRAPLDITEIWMDIPNILKTGHDDCEGLSSFLAAECRVRAPNSLGPRKRKLAGVRLKITKTPGLLHAQVYDPETNEIFDPSRKLGMGRKRNG